MTLNASSFSSSQENRTDHGQCQLCWACPSLRCIYQEPLLFFVTLHPVWGCQVDPGRQLTRRLTATCPHPSPYSIQASWGRASRRRNPSTSIWTRSCTDITDNTWYTTLPLIGKTLTSMSLCTTFVTIGKAKIWLLICPCHFLVAWAPTQYYKMHYTPLEGSLLGYTHTPTIRSGVWGRGKTPQLPTKSKNKTNKQKQNINRRSWDRMRRSWMCSGASCGVSRSRLPAYEPTLWRPTRSLLRKKVKKKKKKWRVFIIIINSTRGARQRLCRESPCWWATCSCRLSNNKCHRRLIIIIMMVAVAYLPNNLKCFHSQWHSHKTKTIKQKNKNKNKSKKTKAKITQSTKFVSDLHFTIKIKEIKWLKFNNRFCLFIFFKAFCESKDCWQLCGWIIQCTFNHSFI